MYGFGYHRWAYDVDCCGTDNGYCAQASFAGQGEMNCIYVIQHTLVDVSDDPLQLFGGISGSFGAQAQFNMSGYIDQFFSVNGLSGDSDFQCDVNTEYSSEVGFAGYAAVGDLEMDDLILYAAGTLNAAANSSGTEWGYQAVVGTMFEVGNFKFMSACSVVGNQQETSTQFLIGGQSQF